MSRFSIIFLILTQVWMCFVCFVAFRGYKQRTASLRILAWYILASSVLDVVKAFMVYQNIHTLWLSQCFSVFELSLFLSMFHYWRTSKRSSSLMWALFMIYLLIWIVGKFSFEPFTGSDNYSGAVSQTIQIGFGIWLFISDLHGNKIVWKNDPRFWVLSGIILYAAATFFLFGLFNVLVAASLALMKLIWNFNLFFVCVQYYLFLRGFLCNTITEREIVKG
jgi:hypothetical protein